MHTEVFKFSECGSERHQNLHCRYGTFLTNHNRFRNDAYLCRKITYNRGMQSKRRTGEELLDALAAAIMTELTEHGYQNLTFEGVARRAKTSKPVLYRRFTTRSEMVTFAAVRTAPAFLTELQDSTSLRKDFQNLINVLQRWMEHIEIVTVLGVLSEASPQQREHFSAVTVHPGFVAVTRLYRAAIARGELSEAVLDPSYIRFPMLLLLADILTRGKVDKTELMKLVDRVIIPRLTTL